MPATPLINRTLLPSGLGVCCCTPHTLTAASAHIPRTSSLIEESAFHTCMTSTASFTLLPVFLPLLSAFERRAIDRITAPCCPHITGGRTGKKKATASLQSLVSTVHATIIAHRNPFVFTHFLPPFSPCFHPLFTPFCSNCFYFQCNSCHFLTLSRRITL